MLNTFTDAEQATIVVAGVDTHKDTHHVAVLSLAGRVLADKEFTADAPGYRAAETFITKHGLIEAVGIELTGSYGAGLTRHFLAAGIDVLEVNTVDKTTRARRGKDDRTDAIAAAKKVLSGDATAIPKDTTGIIEAIRMLMIVRDSAVKARTKAFNQLNALIVTAPEHLRTQFRGLTSRAAANRAQNLRPDPTQLADPIHAAKTAMRRLGTRITDLDDEIKTSDTEISVLTNQIAPTLMAAPQIGPNATAQLLATAAANIDRIGTEGQFARLCGVAPIPVSSGKTDRMRLHRGGDRQANRVLHMIVIGRLKNDPRTRAYMTRRHSDGRSKKEIIRCLKRYVAREVFQALKTDLGTH